MNYLTHGHLSLDRPYHLAGTALPDWLRICGRRLALLPDGRAAEEAADGPGAELLAGCRRHLRDDRLFHADPAFIQVSRRITRWIRDRHPEERRLRAHFLGHVLTEMLLDASLMETQPRLLDRYYEALGTIDPVATQSSVNGWLRSPTEALAPLIERFRALRFLRDYLEDAGVVHRLGQVARRIGLPELPPDLVEVAADARKLVRQRSGELLSVARQSDGAHPQTLPISKP